MIDIEAFQKSISKLLIQPLLWKLTGFVSSIVGFSCYAFSPSVRYLFLPWSPLKIVVYSVVSSLLCILMLFVKRCSGGHGRSFLLKAQVVFVVLALTSLWSVLEDRCEEGKVEHGFSKMMNLASTGAFAFMALSMSRQLQLGFDVGVFNFLVGCFLVTTMKMSLKLAPLAAFFCYLLVNVRSISDFLLELRARGDTQTTADPLHCWKFSVGKKYTQRDGVVKKILHNHLLFLCISLLVEISNTHSTQHADDTVEENLQHHSANSDIFTDEPCFQDLEADSGVLARDTNEANFQEPEASSDVFVHVTDEANFQDLEAYSDVFARDTVANREDFIKKESEESKEAHSLRVSKKSGNDIPNILSPKNIGKSKEVNVIRKYANDVRNFFLPKRL